MGWVASEGFVEGFDITEMKEERKNTHKSYVTAMKSSGGSRGGARGARPPPLPLYF